MVPVIHALGQVVFSKLCGLSCEPASEEASFWENAMQTDLLQCASYGLSTNKLIFCLCNL